MNPLVVADRADVAVLDDQPQALMALNDLLGEQFSVHPFSRADDLIRYVKNGRPVDLVMLDVVMPPPDGFEVCRQLRAMPSMEEVPIILMSALDSPLDEARGLELGAVDYVGKPFNRSVVLNRVGHHVRLGRALRLIMTQNELLDQRVASRTAELASKNTALQHAMSELGRTQDAIFVALSSLAEARDTETGRHIRRTQSYVYELAQVLARRPEYAQTLDGETVEIMSKSAALHDIGKVAIPDHILLKPGRLTPDEFEVMKTHTLHGRAAIETAEASLGSSNTFLHHARDIAYGHHERWDGSGYPQGIAGNAIPLAARMMAVADVYDALTTARPYKQPLGHARVVEMILQERGRHFDPDVADAFAGLADRFESIGRELAD